MADKPDIGNARQKVWALLDRPPENTRAADVRLSVDNATVEDSLIALLDETLALLVHDKEMSSAPEALPSRRTCCAAASPPCGRLPNLNRPWKQFVRIFHRMSRR